MEKFESSCDNLQTVRRLEEKAHRLQEENRILRDRDSHQRTTIDGSSANESYLKNSLQNAFQDVVCSLFILSWVSLLRKEARRSSVVRAFTHGAMGRRLHGVDPLSYFSFQLVLHDWCNKGCGMCYPVYGMVHIKEPLLLLGKSSPCGGSRFPLSLSEWSFTICPTSYNRK